MTSNSPQQQRQFRSSGFAVLRTPLLPFDEYVLWGARVASRSNPAFVGAENAEDSVQPQSASLELLREFIGRTDFIEAVWVASPDLYNALADWLAGRGKLETRRLQQSLIRYFTRASNRCTPFGLFAGCSLMTIEDVTYLELCPRSAYSRRSRLDMDHVAELTRVIIADTEARGRLKLFSNSSAIHVGGRFHYVETRYNGRRRQYVLTAVDPIPEISDILSRAEHGIRCQDLVESLEAAGFDRGEIDEFLTELLDAQLLVPAVEPLLTGGEAAAVLADDLEEAECRPDISEALRTVNANLKRIDTNGVGCPPEKYDAALSPLSALPVPVDSKRVLQVDLFKPAPALSLSNAVVDDLVVAAELLLSLSLRPDPLAEFASRFQERYETQEVPLLEALDEEVGIGLPDANTNDRLMRAITSGIRQREAWLAELRARAARQNVHAVELEDAHIDRLNSAYEPRPPCNALAVLATLLATSADHVNRGEYSLLVHYVMGPSGARMLGRFAHLDPALESEIRRYLRAEEALNPEAIFAEIVHLPQGRIGNVSARPVLRDYEISYLGRGGAARAKQILPSDLTVSVRDGRVSLRSITLDREVLPRLTSAHNYSTGRELPVYRFLAALQDHGVAGTSAWSWGAQASARSLPRVTCGRLILARAGWTLSGDEIKALSPKEPNAHRAFQRWRETWNVPRYIELGDGDNRIAVDCANAHSVEALLQLIRGRPTAILHEMPYNSESLCVRGPEGSFTNEILVPLLRVNGTSSAAAGGAHQRPAQQVRAAAASVTRRYPPGSEWVYSKLYCGNGSSDLVLRSVVAPLVIKLTENGLIEKWFFVRYGDPRFHIRLRFRASSGRVGRIMEFVGASCAESVGNGRISRLLFDTYQPEVERYGGAASIALAESMFHCDSVSALEIVLRSTGESVGDAADRDILALSGIERYFDDAQLGISERINFLAGLLRDTSAADRRQRSVQFRTRRSAVAEAVATSRATSDKSWLTEILDRRSVDSRAILRELRNLESRGQLLRPVDDMLVSFAHLWINRLIRVAGAIEPTLYDLLHRHYSSELARARSDRSATVAVQLEE